MIGGHKSPSYQVCPEDGQDCFRLDWNSGADPCWGEVVCMDLIGLEETIRYGVCRGHREQIVDDDPGSKFYPLEQWPYHREGQMSEEWALFGGG